ncbi:MAG: sulfotransferase family protein [Actinomycetota bacterium]
MSTIDPFFIVASARSGTTFLRLTLNAHPDVAVPPESRFITELYAKEDIVDVPDYLARLEAHIRFKAWDLPIENVAAEIDDRSSIPYADAIRATYRAYAASRGKTAWGDKTPRYVEQIPFLARMFPEARFVHIVRDGRNVALSYSHVNFGPKNIARAARLWARRVEAGIRDGRALPKGSYLEILSEDLAEDIEGEVKDICAFLGLDFDVRMLDPDERAKGVVEKVTHSYEPGVSGRSKMSRWQDEMSPADIEVFEAVAGRVLSELGYERRFPDPGPLAKLKAALALKGLPIGRLTKTPVS